MSKSLIKTVEGIGIWVADTTTESFGIRELVGFIVGIIISIIIDVMAYTNNGGDIKVISLLPIIDSIIVIGIMLFGRMFGILFVEIPSYKVYSGSDTGITIIKTTTESDQIAICKAAKEIEFRCHEIAEKRRELDRIAGNCK